MKLKMWGLFLLLSVFNLVFFLSGLFYPDIFSMGFFLVAEVVFLITVWLGFEAGFYMILASVVAILTYFYCISYFDWNFLAAVLVLDFLMFFVVRYNYKIEKKIKREKEEKEKDKATVGA